MWAPPLDMLLDYYKNLPQAQTEGCRSYFKFEPAENNQLVVYQRRVTPWDLSPKWRKVGTVPDSQSFMKLAQGHLVMLDDTTEGDWAEPKKWSIE